MAHGDADALGDAFAAEGRVAELFGNEAFGGEQVGGAEGADAVLAGLPGDDAGEQLQHVAFEVLGFAVGGAVEEALGALAEGAGEQALQAGFRADLERAVEAAQAAFAEQRLGDVEDELAHGAGEAEQVGLVGAVDDHLPRLQQGAAFALVEERAAFLHQGDEHRFLGHGADHRAVALHHVLVAAHQGEAHGAQFEVGLRGGQAAVGVGGAFEADEDGGVVLLPEPQALFDRDVAGTGSPGLEQGGCSHSYCSRVRRISNPRAKHRQFPGTGRRAHPLWGWATPGH